MFTKLLESKNAFFTALLLSAAFVGVLNSGHHVLKAHFLAQEGKNYLSPSFVDDFDTANVVGPRIKDVLDGKIMVSDVDLWEYRNYPPVWPPLSPLSFWPFKFFTDRVSTVTTVSDFLFPALSFLLFFALYYLLSGKRKWPSMFFALFTSIFVYFSVFFPPFGATNLRALIRSAIPFNLVGSPEAFFLTRRESFIPSLPPILAALFFIYLAATREKKIFAMLAGVFYALLSYYYPFHFVYVSAIVGILFLFFLFTRNKQGVVQMLVLFGAALVCLIPFAINQWNLRHLPWFSDIEARHGIEYGRAIRGDNWKRYLALLSLSGIVFWVERKAGRGMGRAYFVMSMLLAGIAVLNMQVLLGMSLQSDHWVNRNMYIGMNIAYFMLFLFVIDYLKNRKIWRNFFLGIAVLLLVFASATSLRATYLNSKAMYPYYTLPVSTQRMLAWLQANTPKDSVVMTPSLVDNYLIPLYTSNRIYIPRAYNTLAPEAESFERLFIAYKTFGVSGEHLATVLDAKQYRDVSFHDLESGLDRYERLGVVYLSAFKYMDKTLQAFTHSPSIDEQYKLPDARYAELIKQFRDFKCDGDCLKKYRIDYLLFGPQEKKIGAQDPSRSNARLDKVYDQDGVEIYRIVR